MERNVNAIWSGLNDHLNGFVLKRVDDKEAVGDIIQDVFLKVHSKIGTLKDDESVTSWIFQITRNAITDYYRKQQKSNREISKVEQIEDLHHTDETQEFSRCVSPMINALPDKYKEALTLSEIEGLPQNELAELLGISYSGAKSRVQRGREKLKDLLLQCCTITTDKYGNIIEYDQKDCQGNCT